MSLVVRPWSTPNVPGTSPLRSTSKSLTTSSARRHPYPSQTSIGSSDRPLWEPRLAPKFRLVQRPPLPCLASRQTRGLIEPYTRPSLRSPDDLFTGDCPPVRKVSLTCMPTPIPRRDMPTPTAFNPYRVPKAGRDWAALNNRCCYKYKQHVFLETHPVRQV